MDIGALAPYERALLRPGRLGLLTDDGRTIELDVRRWLAEADETDETVLDRCVGPVLDVGCGPGRFISALNARGVPALGVDIAESAIALTRTQGFPALLRSVFANLPGEGRWPTVLLMDGNIGIGGDPLRLLTRISSVMAPHGTLVIEVHPDDDADDVLEVRFTEHGRPVGPTFDWANVGRSSLLRYAAQTGYAFDALWSSGGRTFVVLGLSTVRARVIPIR